MITSQELSEKLKIPLDEAELLHSNMQGANIWAYSEGTRQKVLSLLNQIGIKANNIAGCPATTDTASLIYLLVVDIDKLIRGKK